MVKYAEVLFRHGLRFAALGLISVILGVTVAAVFATFRASAAITIQDPAAFGASFQPVGWSTNQTPAQNLADSMSQLVKSHAFAQSLSDRLSSGGATSSSAELQQTLASTAAGLRVNASGSHLITITYTCAHASLCVLVVSSTIAIFQAQLAKVQQDQVTATTSFWTAQLTDAQSNLAAAQHALSLYAAANPGVALDAGSNDPQVVQLVGAVQLWRAKVVEAQSGLGQAQYSAAASERFLQFGTTVADPPHLVGAQVIGDGSSLVPGALAALIALAVVGAYLVLMAWVDRTASDPKAVERRLGLPVVATIPRLVGSVGA
jgi:hypothetical protein